MEQSVVGQICALLMHPQAAVQSSVRSATVHPFHSATLYVCACMRMINVPLNCRRMLVCFWQIGKKEAGSKICLAEMTQNLGHTSSQNLPFCSILFFDCVCLYMSVSNMHIQPTSVCVWHVDAADSGPQVH